MCNHVYAEPVSAAAPWRAVACEAGQERQGHMVVSRCLGIGPPSGIPSLGRYFCWPTNFAASHLGNTPPSLYYLIHAFAPTLGLGPPKGASID